MLYLFFGALCITTAPLFVKMSDLGPTMIALGRCFFGGIFLSYFIWKDKSKLNKFLKDWHYSRWLLLAGFIFFLDLFVWHKSIIYIGAGKATVLGNTQIFYSALLGYVFYKEPIRWNLILGGVIALMGIWLMIWTNGNNTTELYTLGMLFGISTGLFYSIYILSLSQSSRWDSNKHQISDGCKLGIVCFISSFFLAPAAILENQLILPDKSDLLILLGLGLIPQFLGWLSIKKGLKNTPLAISGLILLLQPALATLGGMVFFQEHLSIFQGIGIMLVLIGIGLGTYRKT